MTRNGNGNGEWGIIIGEVYNNEKHLLFSYPITLSSNLTSPPTPAHEKCPSLRLEINEYQLRGISTYVGFS